MTRSMPLVNESKEITLVLSGELFFASSQVDELRARGHDFPAGDCSHLVHLYEELGDNFFGALNGWFSGVLIDRRRNRTFVFNDRFGMHRLFGHQAKDGMFVASEAKALLAALPDSRHFDPQGLCEFVTCGCTIGNHSLFKGIEVLPGGSLLEFANGVLLRRATYFNRDLWERQERLPDGEFISQFTSIFPKVVQRYFSARRPVAMSLTGGLDSRMVLGCFDPPKRSVPCYTFGSTYRDTFDVKVARRVAQECGQQHKVLEVGDGFTIELESYLEKAVLTSDGYLGLSGAAELYANSLAREIAPVRLTGNYGSELLRHARAFKFRIPRGEILGLELSRFVEETRRTFDQMNEMRDVSFVAFHQAPNQGYGRLSVERSQLDLRTPFLDNEIVELCYRASDTCDGFSVVNAVLNACNPRLEEIPTDRGYLGIGPLSLRALRRAYRQALFKGEYWTGRGAPDWLVRTERLLKWVRMEETFLARHKFYDLRVWLRDRLKGYVREALYEDSSLEFWRYFDREATLHMVNHHLLEKNNRTDEIDTVLTLALTSRLLFSSNKTGVETVIVNNYKC